MTYRDHLLEKNGGAGGNGSGMWGEVMVLSKTTKVSVTLPIEWATVGLAVPMPDPLCTAGIFGDSCTSHQGTVVMENTKSEVILTWAQLSGVIPLTGLDS